MVENEKENRREQPGRKSSDHTPWWRIVPIRNFRDAGKRQQQQHNNDNNNNNNNNNNNSSRHVGSVLVRPPASRLFNCPLEGCRERGGAACRRLRRPQESERTNERDAQART